MFHQYLQIVIYQIILTAKKLLKLLPNHYFSFLDSEQPQQIYIVIHSAITL